MDHLAIAGHRRSEQIAKHVANEISAGRFGPGERLPSERQLALDLSVSRPLVREGYRILESLGVVEVRQGSGVYVADRGVFDATKDQIWTRPVEMMDVLAFGDVMNSRCGELAAANITDEEIACLRAILERQRRATTEFDLEELAETDREFHATIAHASRNPIMESFEQLSRRVLKRDRVLLLGTAADRSLVEHGQIIDALAARNPGLAGVAMRLHTIRSHAVMRELIDRHRQNGAKGA